MTLHQTGNQTGSDLYVTTGSNQYITIKVRVPSATIIAIKLTIQRAHVAPRNKNMLPTMPAKNIRHKEARTYLATSCPGATG